MNYMIDLETLDTVPSAAVLSIGIVPFDKGWVSTEGDEFYLHLDPQFEVCRTVNESTFMWWLEQSPEARSLQVQAERLHPKIALTSISAIIQDKPGKVWSKGPDFDIAILRSMYRDFDMSVPWAFWGVRCVRTIMDVAPEAGFIEAKFDGVRHSALADALVQAKIVSQLLS